MQCEREKVYTAAKPQKYSAKKKSTEEEMKK